MLQTIATGGLPRRHPAHLPMMITFDADNPFFVRTATKGIGLVPRSVVLNRYLGHLEETLRRCDGRSWDETLAERVAAVGALLEHPEDVDPCRLGSLEIFQGHTYANLHRDPRVILHFTGDGPDYLSYQINGYVDILTSDDPYAQYIALSRRLFEEASFHLPQPGYVAAYLVEVHEVLSKTPYVVSAPDPTPLPIPTPASHPRPQAAPTLVNEPSPKVSMRDILVPVDNSAYSAWAIDIALHLGRAFQSTVVGNHVYAARLHERRFQDMEPGLPEAYQEPTILAHQRDLHTTLIEKGLKLIADSYLEALNQRCRQAGLRYTAKTPEGKNYAQLVQDIETSGYDLVVMGARGLGATWRCGKRRDHMLGSVCERVVRRVSRDVLVVKDAQPLGGTFVVGVDGSPRGFGALRVALAVAEAIGAQVQAVAAYDPSLHATVFHTLAETLTEEAKQVFNTTAQKKLHDELVDSGIARLYQGHLETAQRIAAGMGHEIDTHLLSGKAYAAVLRYVTQVQPSLLVLGRTGLHADEGLDIGSTAENLLRLAPCHVLLVGRSFTPPCAEGREAMEEHLPWTPEALARLNRVPTFVRSMVHQAIENYARQHGHTVVEVAVVQEARQQLEG
jgi:nucleotide-binding universal stress UspA family protein